MLRRNNIILCFLFALSLLLRTPTLDRPVSKHHEFNIAFFLIPMEIWEKEGIIAHHFFPPYNYGNSNDKFIYSLIAVEEGIKDGTEYYLSFPGFSYILPYFFMKLFFLKISVLNLQLFNLIIHFLICLILFKILNSQFENLPALFGTSLYIFSPGTMWFHGNAYSFHSLSVFTCLLTVYALILYFQYQGNRTSNLFYFGISLFFFLYTEWIAIIFIFFLFIFLFFQHKQNDKVKNIMLVSALALSLFFLLLLFQNASFFGVDQYVEYLTNRFSHRSTLVNRTIPLNIQLVSVSKHFVSTYGIWLLLFFFLIAKPVRKSINDKSYRPVAIYVTLFFILLLSVLFYHLLFMQFTVEHDYSVLMDGLLISSMIAFMIARYKLNSKQYFSLFCLMIIASAIQYYYINPPGEYSLKNDLYASYKNIGTTIKQTSTQDETVFIKGFSSKMDRNNPQIVYYSKRNFLPIDHTEEAYVFLRKQHRFKGRIYLLEFDKIKNIIPVNISDP